MSLSPRFKRLATPAFTVLAVLAAALLFGTTRSASQGNTGRDRDGDAAAFEVKRRPFVRSIRLHGLVESIRSHSVAAPRLIGATGPGSNALIITRLAGSGIQVVQDQLLVEFDRQSQLKAALDRRAEHRDLQEQISKKRAEQEQVRAKDDAELALAGHAVESARLDMKKNEVLSRIDAEKNAQRLEEAEARLKQLKTTFDLKRRAEQAEVRILEIQRDRAGTAMQHAERNADRMVVRSPISGLVVLRTNWRAGQMVEIQEGEEARPGMPILQVVDPSAMLVRVKVNQADVHDLRPGQTARTSLDAYPGLEFQGRVEHVAPVGTTSTLSTRVRNFVAIVSIQGNNPKLMPDLSAAVDVELERRDNQLVVPRDSVARRDTSAFVRITDGSRTTEREVTLGAANDVEVIVSSGLQPGERVLRHIAAGAGR